VHNNSESATVLLVYWKDATEYSIVNVHVKTNSDGTVECTFSNRRMMAHADSPQGDGFLSRV